MNTCTREEIAEVQNTVIMLCQICHAQDQELIERYLEQTGRIADGTMDAILPHFFSINDMHHGQKNLKFIRSVLEHIRSIQQLAEQQIQVEASR